MIKLNNKTKFHIHIYKVVSKATVEISANDETGAKSKALLLAKRKKLIFKKSDCDYIAIGFDKEGQMVIFDNIKGRII